MCKGAEAYKSRVHSGNCTQSRVTETEHEQGNRGCLGRLDRQKPKGGKQTRTIENETGTGRRRTGTITHGGQGNRKRSLDTAV